MPDTRLVDVRVERLIRYPVKGLAGVECDHVLLLEGRGLPLDRQLAITNGESAVPPRRGWVAPGHLYGLARNPGLTRLDVRLAVGEPSRVSVSAPDGCVFAVPVDPAPGTASGLDEASELVQGLVAPGRYAPARVISSRAPLWQQEGRALSLVNWETLRALGRAWGCDVDYRRLRPNVCLDGMAAWEELGLVGRRVRIGGAQVEVLGPMRRGAGAAVDPDDGSTGLDVAAALEAEVGHRYLGVHAVVVRTGRVRRGDALKVMEPATREWQQLTAAGPGTPRRVQVVACDREGPLALSLWLRDPANLATRAQHGQHVRLHTEDAAGPLWRKYTVSAVDGDLARVSIGFEPGGRLSELLRTAEMDELRLDLTGPFGDSRLDPTGPQPVLLLTAGIGITPSVAWLRDMVRRAPVRPVGVLHVARDGDRALWDELVALTDALPGAARRVALHLTGADADRCRQIAAKQGRPRAADVARLIRSLPAGVTALVCGPDQFRVDMRAALRLAGLPDTQIVMESFYSPPVRRPEVPIPDAGPFLVSFSASGLTVEWKPDQGSLLDLAESCGIRPQVDCREAACNVCAATITSGNTAYTTPPMAPPPNRVLVCCAIPTSDVTVDL